MTTEYEITYSIRRRFSDDDDFVEIGFGSSGAWDDIECASWAMGSDIAGYNWETTSGMPDPEDVQRDEKEARNE